VFRARSKREEESQEYDGSGGGGVVNKEGMTERRANAKRRMIGRRATMGEAFSPPPAAA
jgi:hypothetical protein